MRYGYSADRWKAWSVLDLAAIKRPEATTRFRGVWVSDDLCGVCNTCWKKAYSSGSRHTDRMNPPQMTTSAIIIMTMAEVLILCLLVHVRVRL